MEQQKDVTMSDVGGVDYRCFNKHINELCNAFGTNANCNKLKKQILKYFINHPISLKMAVAKDETFIIGKIIDHLRNGKNNGNENEIIFKILYENVVDACNDVKQRSLIFEFLYNTAVENSLAQTTGMLSFLCNLKESSTSINYKPKIHRSSMEEALLPAVLKNNITNLPAVETNTLTNKNVKAELVDSEDKESTRSSDDLNKNKIIISLFTDENAERETQSTASVNVANNLLTYQRKVQPKPAIKGSCRHLTSIAERSSSKQKNCLSSDQKGFHSRPINCRASGSILEMNCARRVESRPIKKYINIPNTKTSQRFEKMYLSSARNNHSEAETSVLMNFFNPSHSSKQSTIHSLESTITRPDNLNNDNSNYVIHSSRAQETKYETALVQEDINNIKNSLPDIKNLVYSVNFSIPQANLSSLPRMEVLNNRTKTCPLDMEFNSLDAEVTQEPRNSEKNLSCRNVPSSTKIVQSIISIFTGMENDFFIRDPVTGKYIINSETVYFKEDQANILLKISELGVLHDQVLRIEKSEYRSDNGIFRQNFIRVFKEELTKYYGYVGILQDKLHRLLLDCSGRKSNSMASQSTDNSKCDYEKRSAELDQILVTALNWYSSPMKHFQCLNQIADVCKDGKGGNLISILYKTLCQETDNDGGIVNDIIKRFLMAVMIPFYNMLSNWLLFGEIRDSHEEFFIACNDDIPWEFFWNDKYKIKTHMLPCFISRKLAVKLLTIGKSVILLSYFNEITVGNKYASSLVASFERNPDSIYNSHDSEFDTLVESLYDYSTSYLLDIVVTKHRLFDHFNGIRRYILFGQGDFILHLIEAMKNKLDRPASDITNINTIEIIKDALYKTNAKFDDSEIVECLQLKLHKSFDKNLVGWDIVTLDYTVNNNLLPIFGSFMYEYSTIFKSLWHLRHIEYVCTESIWKRQKDFEQYLKTYYGPIIKPMIYSFYILLGKMNHFIHQLESYFLYDVIEFGWCELKSHVNSAKDLDRILDAHSFFLYKIKTGLFLEDRNEKTKINLKEVFNIILSLKVWQCKILDELQIRCKIDDIVITISDENIFADFIIEQEHILQKATEDYNKAFQSFLFTLRRANNPNFHILANRLSSNDGEELKEIERECFMDHTS